MDGSSSFVHIGGHPVLDFLNTAGGRTKARDAERLPHYADAVRWGTVLDLIDSKEAEYLRSLADAAPRHAEHVTLDLREQREALHRLLAALVEDRAVSATDRSRVEADLKAAYAAARLRDPRSEPGGWSVDVEDAGLRTLSHRIALAASAILASDVRRHVKMCEACSWMFLDLSRSRRRRWCSMAACGNRAKARRHYHKAP